MAEAATLLKTCQTCAHAKIRCVKTQDSGACDRCLRLDKRCVFSKARRSLRAHNTRYERRARTSSPQSSSTVSSHLNPAQNASRPDEFHHPSLQYRSHTSDFSSFDPFQDGLLSYETAQSLVTTFRSKMAAHFPFVVLDEADSVPTLRRYRPCLLLAIATVASSHDLELQQNLGTLFNHSVASKLVVGPIAELDLLQGLLVYTAWAHYQPRPKRYTQHLHLATSIVCDLRLDRPKRTKFWDVEGGNDRDAEQQGEWGPDEIRAMAGAYYLASSSSILLQKSQHFFYHPNILAFCENVAQRSQAPSDAYLPCIIGLQKLLEETSDAASKAATLTAERRREFEAQVRHIKHQHSEIKANISFPLSDCPPVLVQLNLLDLLLSQVSQDGTLFGLYYLQSKTESPDVSSNTTEQEGGYFEWLSTSVSAARSLLDVVLLLPKGDEASISNITWIMVYCGLSLAVRLDLAAAAAARAHISSPSSGLQHLRRLLDMAHALRQLVLKLESANHGQGPSPGSEPGTKQHSHPIQGFAARVRRLESWYLDKLGKLEPSQQTAQQGGTREAIPNAQATSMAHGSTLSGGLLTEQQQALPTSSAYMWQWNGTQQQLGADGITSAVDLANFLFTDPVTYQQDIDLGGYGAW